MCFHSKQSKDAQQIQQRFKAEFKNISEYEHPYIYNGFEHPKTPVITSKEPKNIQLFNWGLLPSWGNKNNFKLKSTLNARMETLAETSSYKNILQNRCLILLDCFQEYQWIDHKGKSKQEYGLTLPNDEAFGLAGLWDVNFINQIPYFSYTIITTEATGIMAEIHNSKLRMPLIISKDFENEWLNNNNLKIDKHLKIDNNLIIASKIGKPTKPIQKTLF